MIYALFYVKCYFIFKLNFLSLIDFVISLARNLTIRKRNSMIMNLLIGGVLALVCIGIICLLFPNKEIHVWSIGIVIAALIYVLFAVNKEAWNYLPMELVGVLFYSILAWLSIKYNTYWLALAWGLHIGWDVLLHDPITTSYVPVGYPSACIGFDIIIVCYVLWISRKKMV